MAKRKKHGGKLDRLTVNHIKERHSVFVCFYDGNLSGTMEISPEYAIAIGEVGAMAKVYREEMEKLGDA